RGRVVEHQAGDRPEDADPVLVVERLDVEARLTSHFAGPYATPLDKDRVCPAGRAFWSARRVKSGAASHRRRSGAGRLTSEPSMRMATERRTPMSVLLSAAERALSIDLEDGLREAGYRDVRAAHAQVFVAIDVEGSRLTDLAARAGMTKQAMGELVRYLEQHDYLEVEPDTRDRRAKLIRPTERGWSAHEVSIALLADADRKLADRLGDQALRDLRAQLRRIGEG